MDTLSRLVSEATKEAFVPVVLYLWMGFSLWNMQKGTRRPVRSAIWSTAEWASYLVVCLVILLGVPYAFSDLYERSSWLALSIYGAAVLVVILSAVIVAVQKRGEELNLPDQDTEAMQTKSEGRLVQSSDAEEPQGDGVLARTRRHTCTCPRNGLLAVEEGRHKPHCPFMRTDWPMGKRLRYWLGRRIPVGGVTQYKGDDSQRRMAPGDRHGDPLYARTPAGTMRVEGSTPAYIRFQRRVAVEAESVAWSGDPPTWRHLRQRCSTLLIQGTVVLRRWLVWLAPFIAVFYIVYDTIRG